ncbi:hypothetical protein, partial [Mesorhizobium sp.]|uniref:hypothetical protein n=1 Tax=Mesorhizobium sp. TaxID=1871066 RepID=UPI0025DF8D09
LHRLSNKRTECCILGVGCALQVFPDGGGRLLNRPGGPLRSGVSPCDRFVCALFTVAPEVTQSCDYVTILH